MTSAWKNKQLRLSVNERLVNKNDLDDTSAFTDGWKNKEITIDDLEKSISSGFAYCAELNGPRKSENFAASDILSVDIDFANSLDDFRNNDLVRNHATLIYTTHSHTSEQPRFRIVFALGRTIIGAGEMKAAARSLALRLSGDPSVIDAARIFYGSSDCKSQTFDKGIDNNLLDELISQGRNVSTAITDHDKKQQGSGRSELTFEPNRQVKVSDGSWVRINQLDVRTQICCPFHRDENPSAFIMKNQSGQKGIYCSTCAVSFWEEEANHSLDFNALEKMARVVKRHLDDIDAREVFSDEPKIGAALGKTKIRFLDQQFVGNLPINEGANFIKSPKASGKTEFLKHIAERNKGNILLIGHRRSLIKQMCNRLGLNCYLDKPPEGAEVYFSKYSRYGVCLDSISKVPNEITYDYIFIDECEQVLSHLLSSTLDDKRQNAFLKLIMLVGTAKHIVALDADLSLLSFQYISDWAQARNHDSASTLSINDYERDQGKLYVFNSRPQIIGDIHRAVKAGLRCYITSNSKNLINQLKESIEDENESAKVISITSDTVGGSEQFEFLDDPVLHAAKYDVILTSPSVSTGVDITFPDDEKQIDIVYGIFEPLILTHFECDQQLLRVRHPKATKVYVSPRIFNFETNFDVVRKDATGLKMMDRVLIGYDKDQKMRYNEEDPLLQIVSSVLSIQRASKNRLKQNFLDYKKEQGWTIVEVENDEDVIKHGSEAAVRGKSLVVEHARRTLLDAPKVSREELNKLSQKKNGEFSLSPDENARYVRGLIETFYREDISTDLINLDDNGRYRSAVKLFELLTDPEILKLQDYIDDTKNELDNNRLFLIPNDHVRSRFLARCLEVSGVYKDCAFDIEREFSSADLKDFVSFIKKHKSHYELAFDMDPRRDLSAKPMITLSSLMKKVGLSMPKTRTKRSGKKKEYFYKIDQGLYQRISKIKYRRKSTKRG